MKSLNLGNVLVGLLTGPTEDDIAANIEGQRLAMLEGLERQKLYDLRRAESYDAQGARLQTFAATASEPMRAMQLKHEAAEFAMRGHKLRTNIPLIVAEISRVRKAGRSWKP